MLLSACHGEGSATTACTALKQPDMQSKGARRPPPEAGKDAGAALPLDEIMEAAAKGQDADGAGISQAAAEEEGLPYRRLSTGLHVALRDLWVRPHHRMPGATCRIAEMPELLERRATLAWCLASESELTSSQWT